ncbi:Uncharacterised protein [uncultured archaeon]|nr:Uncharacterised protein [uncultured archaeon]
MLVAPFLKRNSFSRRGFIGPIGDDLPSLVPLVISLLLFFSIFTLTLNTYNTKNFFINKQIEMTSAAREIKGDSLILNMDQFMKKCRTVSGKNFPYNFMVGIYGADSDLRTTVSDLLDLQNNGSNPNNQILSADLAGSKQNYFCVYKHVGALPFTQNAKTAYLLRYYPVAVQQAITRTVNGAAVTEYLIIPGVMAMVVWE